MNKNEIMTKFLKSDLFRSIASGFAAGAVALVAMQPALVSHLAEMVPHLAS